MKKYNNIFLQIDYQKETVLVDLNKPFIAYLHHYYILHSKKDDPYVNWNINPLWSFEYLTSALKKYCSAYQIKCFLKQYPDFIEYFI